MSCDMADILSTLRTLRTSGNLRSIPGDNNPELVDLSSNDYLGIASRADIRQTFVSEHLPKLMADSKDGKALFSSSASRLLAAAQSQYAAFESLLSREYGRAALLFNSGYHANTGIIPAIADHNTLILADRLVHASIIDGIKLSGAAFERFRHNDLNHLERIIAKKSGEFKSMLIIAESVYSMDGDRADIDRLIDIKRHTHGAMLYIDEAHGVGVEGPAGLGLVQASSAPENIDIVIGTLGKALASIGAYAIVSDAMRDYLINRARSFIFSTSLPPLNVAWSKYIFECQLGMDSERKHLHTLGEELHKALHTSTASHIQPYIIGNPHDALAMSALLCNAGFKVLPIRTPTVPPGTDRLRISLSASISTDTITGFCSTLLSANAI